MRLLSTTHRFFPTIFLLAASSLTACQAADVVHTSSYYVEMRDGTRLAVDVTLPTNLSARSQVPALLELTRYGRSREDPGTGEPLPSLGALDRYFVDNGYAVVKVDARGSGASFGTRLVEYGPEEVRDGYDIVGWVVRQDWSDGTVGAYGTSYSGTTAELLAAVQHPAVKAVVPGWSDFDVYPSPARPYGLVASSFLRTWGEVVGILDENDTAALGASIRRVDEDRDGSLLAAALLEHEANPDVFEAATEAQFRDDVVGGFSTWAELAPLHWRKEIQESGVPMLVLVSWMDAGTAEGALLRFQHFTNPQNLVIMATNHGGAMHASPYTVADDPVDPEPSIHEQFDLRLAFFDRHLKSEDNGVDAWPAMRYYNLGEERFRETESWPPPGTEIERVYLGEAFSLIEEAPVSATGADLYQVDPTTSTGETNRWMTQMGSPVLGLHDRGPMDERMLAYTGEPLAEPLQIAGQPVVTLRLSSDRTDGIVLAYLEDVDETGQSRYLTEGGLRLIHRAERPDPYFGRAGPYHSFAREDAEPMAPDAIEEVRFKMQPIAALVRAGHRLRIAIAGADADTFDRLPAEGLATLTIHRNQARPSFVELPIVAGGTTRH